MTQQYWERLLSYQSTQTIQKRLDNIYQHLHINNSNQLSYDNCYRFVYFLKHGENFFMQANQSPHAIQPMLLFYGLSQLIKACLLILDPEYPSSSTVLSHGVSSRKRKKQHYLFLNDEVKVQRNGLFPHIATKLYNIKHLEIEKYSMDLLLRQIPEMNEVYQFHLEKELFLKINSSQHEFVITEDISNHFHISSKRLAEILCENYAFEHLPNTKDSVVTINKNSVFKYNLNPFLYCLEDDCYYLPSTKDAFLNLPEILVHYLLLYNLSMISRYETEWWYDLLLTAPNNDYPFILRYMEIAKKKIPFYIINFLEDML
ncbi:YaaC family protein [Metabacillus niabensis]|uniref:YaaC-like Protein n=1 Tax=Metabacillus niabensis TaxID=324854 RepID=A0ABT9Z9H1_9BACI|nr:YaaC family protein [Metabacillus niabensis]MDQ0228660.1 hypothetical protein [Metabacillus niabensis]